MIIARISLVMTARNGTRSYAQEIASEMCMSGSSSIDTEVVRRMDNGAHDELEKRLCADQRA